MAENDTVVIKAGPLVVGDVRQMMTAALMAALLAASAWFALPVGTVPFTLQVLIVLLAGLILSPGRAMMAVGVYIVLGAIGVPVFAGGQGGLGIIAGPTGGYIIGFLFAAPLVAWLRRALTPKRGYRVFADMVAALSGLLLIYALGCFQLTVVTGMGYLAAFMTGAAPFLALDVGKAVAATALAATLRKAGVVPDRP